MTTVLEELFRKDRNFGLDPLHRRTASITCGTTVGRRGDNGKAERIAILRQMAEELEEADDGYRCPYCHRAECSH